MVHRFVATVADDTHQVHVEALEPGRFRVTIDGRAREIDAVRVERGCWSLLTVGGGPSRLIDVEGALPDLIVSTPAGSLAIKLVDAAKAVAERAAAKVKTGPQPVRAPMPGKVVKILVKAGDAVKAGQGVVVVEAMKMENELKAARDGVVVALGVREGQAVDAGQELATIE